MRVEPAIDRVQLAATLLHSHGLVVERLTFIPIGYATACYRVQDPAGVSHVVKLWLTSDAPQATDSLPLLRALVDRALFTRVPQPLPARDGALWAMFASTPYAVFTYLPGQAPPPWPAWPAALRDDLARTIATIHQATARLMDVLPAQERFAIPFERDLHRRLDAVDEIRSTARPGLLALRNLVSPRRADILAQLARLHTLQATVRHAPGPRVLCHTDIGGDNLLLDDTGRLWVLDWDDAIVAPPEHDLHAALDGDLGRFLAVYQAAGGARPLQIDQFAFSLLRRSLADVTARLRRMLTAPRDAEDDADTLAGIDTWGFAQWSTLDTTLARIAAVLGQPPGT